MLRVDQIQAMRVFLNRVQLTGQEVPVFNNVMNGLIQEEQLVVAEARKVQEAAEAARKRPDLKVVEDATEAAAEGSGG